MPNRSFLFPDAKECPRCGTPLPRVLYGYPIWEAFDQLVKHGVPFRLGGCMVGPDSPKYDNRCVRCD